MFKSFITVTIDYIPGWNILNIWPVVSVAIPFSAFVGDYEESDVLKYAQRCVEKEAIKLGANGIVGFRLSSSFVVKENEKMVSEVFAYGTPILGEPKTTTQCDMDLLSS